MATEEDYRELMESGPLPAEKQEHPALAVIVDTLWDDPQRLARANEILEALDTAGFLVISIDDHEAINALPQISAARLMSKIIAGAGFISVL
jgi:hypothetical protein